MMPSGDILRYILEFIDNEYYNISTVSKEFQRIMDGRAKVTIPLGSIEMLEWARNEGYKWGVKTTQVLAHIGNLTVLKWARVNRCPWDKNTCIYAALGGHLDVIKWAYENGCECERWLAACAAAEGYHLDIFKWLYK